MKTIMIVASILLFSCSKDEFSILTSPTALKFLNEQQGSGKFKYKYRLLKYNSCWYKKNDKPYTDLIQFDVYTNANKPTGTWIDYSEWIENPFLITFDNNKIDSICNMTKIEISKNEFLNFN